MIARGDESVLARLVGTATFERGRAYAEHGAVRNCTWNPGGTHVVGQVQGGAPRPYVASVRLTRSSNRQLSSIDAKCSCPVGYNCKHAVALVLADEPADDAPRTPTLTLVRGDIPPAPRPTASTATNAGRIRGGARSAHPSDATWGETVHRGSGAGTQPDDDTDPIDWALPLEALLDADSEPDDPMDEAGPSELALQFELMVTPQASGRRSPAVGPGIRVRPVVPGQSGHWVRSGVSWSSLEYFSYGRRRSPRFGEQLLLMKELLALSRVSGGQNTYSYTDEVVRLEGINSRRLWDLLGEARGLGIPLIQAGRSAQPVTLLPSVVAVTIDVTRTEWGLRAQPRIGTDTLDLPLETSMLIGRPAHGIAWWDETAPPTKAAARDRRAGTSGAAPRTPATGLGLAALDTPVDDDLRAFLRTATVDVPHHDEERFVRTLVPRLRRRVRVRLERHVRPTARGPTGHAHPLPPPRRGPPHPPGLGHGGRGDRRARAPVGNPGTVPRPGRRGDGHGLGGGHPPPPPRTVRAVAGR